MEEVKTRYYTVKQVQQLENCGRDKAYEIAKQLPHETRGKKIYVFSEDYDKYYQEKREKAKSKNPLSQSHQYSNVYSIRKFS